jgi:alanyl aminopeptidase
VSGRGAPRLAALVLALVACTGSRSPASPSTSPTPARPAASTPPAAALPAEAPRPSLRLDRAVVPTRYALDLTLDPAQEEYRGEIAIDLQLARATTRLWLHGGALIIERATITTDAASTPAGAVGAHALTATVDGDLLALTSPRPLGPGGATLRIAFRGRAPVDGDPRGLFRRTDGDDVYLYSHLEPTGARRAFPCFDEPSFKVPWDVTLHVPRGLTALANAPVASERDDGPLRTVTFARTPPMPSYLLAVAVGPFELVDLGAAGARPTPVRIAVPRGRAGEARYAVEVTGALLAEVERYLGLPYPYDKLELVAIPDTGFAMENPGLVTFGARVILARPAEESHDFRAGYAETVAHELAHHWFGDQVSIRWWDDTWLKESFAELVGDRVVERWQPTWSAGMARLRSGQYAKHADRLVSARALHGAIDRDQDIESAFDEIAYAKGSAVLAMFEDFVGADVFRRALAGYLAAHAWGSAGSRDFVDALAAAAGADVAAAFSTFLEQGGVPLVSLDVDCAGDRAELVLAQERFLPLGSTGSSAQTWTIPMCVATPGGPQCFLLAAREARVPLAAPGCPAWVDGNPGGRGYYRVRHAGVLGRQLLDVAGLDPIDRAAALLDLQALVDGGHLPLLELLAVIPAVAADRRPAVLSVAISLATSVAPYVDDDDLPAYQAWLAARFAGAAHAIGWRPRRGEPAEVATLRPRLLEIVAVHGRDRRLVAEARRLAARYLRRPAGLDPDLARLALAAATRAGDDALARRLDPLLATTTEPRLRANLLVGMMRARDPAVRARVLDRLARGALTGDEVFALLTATWLERPARRELVAVIAGHLEPVLTALPLASRAMLVHASRPLCDEAHRRQLDVVFAPIVEGLPGGALALAKAREALDVCIAKRAAVGPDLAALLRAPPR